MYRIKKVKVLPLAYTVGFIYLIIGLILGIVLMVIKINPALAALSSEDLSGLTIQQILLLYPVAYGIGGLIIGGAIGIIYNHVSKLTGGIAVSLKKDKK
tara:strand:- start:289 stop:585 length:297 start_codon:yes stop_codon:yes gene_type:complete